MGNVLLHSGATAAAGSLDWGVPIAEEANRKTAGSVSAQSRSNQINVSPMYSRPTVGGQPTVYIYTLYILICLSIASAHKYVWEQPSFCKRHAVFNAWDISVCCCGWWSRIWVSVETYTWDHCWSIAQAQLSASAEA